MNLTGAEARELRATRGGWLDAKVARLLRDAVHGALRSDRTIGLCERAEAVRGLEALARLLQAERERHWARTGGKRTVATVLLSRLLHRAARLARVIEEVRP